MPALNSGCVRKCSYRSFSIIISPLATLINIASLFISSSSLFPISACVSLFNGIEISKISEFFRTISKSCNVPINAMSSSVFPLVFIAYTFTSNGCMSFAVSLPIDP
ncbi:MAG: hypothetical protein BWX61_00555 [Bacteroidetes bacterium ADurb.Bin035]|nr:MAG: hypothetical protein BWX61_00555 [Bacteroidetes bacterium ADurb.Bin035]